MRTSVDRHEAVGSARGCVKASSDVARREARRVGVSTQDVQDRTAPDYDCNGGTGGHRASVGKGSMLGRVRTGTIDFRCYFMLCLCVDWIHWKTCCLPLGLEVAIRLAGERV